MYLIELYDQGKTKLQELYKDIQSNKVSFEDFRQKLLYMSFIEETLRYISNNEYYYRVVAFDTFDEIYLQYLKSPEYNTYIFLDNYFGFNEGDL
jgi:cytochrome P450